MRSWRLVCVCVCVCVWVDGLMFDVRQVVAVDLNSGMFCGDEGLCWVLKVPYRSIRWTMSNTYRLHVAPGGTC
ncbi:hypothetical protein F5X97DRAFT_308877, partial [Nemania serpens]